MIGEVLIPRKGLLPLIRLVQKNRLCAVPIPFCIYRVNHLCTCNSGNSISRTNFNFLSSTVADLSKKNGQFLYYYVPKRWTGKETGYTFFGHAKRNYSGIEITGFIFFGFMIACVLYESFLGDDWTEAVEEDCSFKAASKKRLVKNKSENDESVGSDDDDDLITVQKETGVVEPKKRKQKSTFRDRKIIAYEDRIRAFSTPEKIFRYFSTLKVYAPGEPQYGPSFEVFMTPEDFVRSITPGTKQPDGLGLEQFATFDPEHDHLRSTLDTDSVFFKLGKHGLISYTDYIFLLTVLSTSARHFALAFKMFDINGDGELDYNEFDMVETVIRNQTSVGARHRDHSTTGTILRRHTNSSLAAYFFGQNLDQKLTIERFLEFQEHLQRDILKLEFQRREPKDGRITEVAFCRMLLQHSGLNEKIQHRMLKRVKKMYKEDEQGITLKDVENFFRFLNDINDVDTALTFYHMAGASVDPRTLQHVARTVANVEISDYVIEVVFALFDENQDGELSNKEFINVMKRRLMRGLEKPKDTGFTRVLSAILSCSYEWISFHHHYNV